MIKKILQAMLFAAAFALVPAAAYAAETNISSVSLSIRDYSKGDGQVYEPQISTSYHTEVTGTWSKDPASCRPGEIITLSAVITPGDGYRFVKKASGKAQKTKVSVSGGSLASETIDSDHKITLRVNYRVRMTLSPVDPAGMWMDDDGVTIHWEEVEYAKAYNIRLSGGTNMMLLVTDQTYSDLSEFIVNDEEETKIEIRATYRSDAQKNYLTPSAWTSFTDGAMPYDDNTSSGVFEGTASKGTLRLLTGKDDDGTRHYATGWQKLGKDQWYYFSQDGFAVVGWADIGGKKYYLDRETAVMQTGWIELNGRWYYLDPTGGDMKSGWIQASPGGKWYYLDPATGAMCTDTWTPDGCYVNASGVWEPQKGKK